MASNLKGKPTKSSFEEDDVPDSLFDNKKKPSRGNVDRSRRLNRSSATDNIFSMLAEEVKRDGLDSENSDVSAADPNDLLKDLKDMDDMDADLFASKKKPSSVPAQTKPLSNDGPKKDSSVLESKNTKPEGADEPTRGGTKSSSAPSSTARNYKKFTFSDDPLTDLLDDLLPDETKPESKPSRIKPEKSAPSPSGSPILKAETPKRAKKGELTFDDDKDELMDALGIDSDEKNLKNKEAPLWSTKEKSEGPPRARTRIDEILESFASPRLSERPPTGERKDQQQEKTPTVKESLLEEDVTFGSYQPTLGSTPEGRQSRRQSVRFSTEDVSVSTPEKKPNPTAPVSSRHRNSADWLGLKTNSEPNYLEDGSKETKTPVDSPMIPSSPLLERKPSLTSGPSAAVAKRAAEGEAPSNQPKTSVSNSQEKGEEDGDDWLAGALSRKKALSSSNTEAKVAKQEDSLDLGQVDFESTVRKQASSRRSKEDTFSSVAETSTTFLGRPSPTAHSTPLREEKAKQDSFHTSPSTPHKSPSIKNEYTPIPQPSTSASSSPTLPYLPLNVGQSLSLSHPSNSEVTGPLPASAASIIHPHPQPRLHHIPHSKRSTMQMEPSQVDETMQHPPLPSNLSATQPATVWFPQWNQTQNISTSTQQQAQLSADSLQQVLLQQQMMLSQLLGLGSVTDTGALQRIRDSEQQPGDYQVLKVRIIQLEGQVKTLQLERDQGQLMLENMQQRHKQDMELLESAHKVRVKLLEDSASQRETRARQECEDLMERLANVTRSAEQERSELQAQYQRKLAQAQQDRDGEVERLRDLQRKSILEMKKDHEDQIQRLKKLKNEEIDAVTSATSQTRSLTGVIDQMEQFSSRLEELSSRVESTHEHTTHGLEQGARHRDEQLRTMQDRLAQQQKATADERTHLKEIISRMDAQLNEQQRQLEKERWKMSAEQAKAESTQRGLEEERRALSMQISMEREELERAKGALLEEQKSVMQHCTEERRKLAAEWAHFHAQEKQRQERAERETSSLMEKREGSIISLAQEQADLKLRTAELKQKELAVTQEQETLERLREELDREKERISSTALRLKTRAQEVEAFSKLAAEKYEDGERAMHEAKRVETEHEARLANIHSQTERLRQQEQRILKERMQLNQVQKDTERMRENPLKAPLPQCIPTETVSLLPNPELASTLNLPSPRISLPNSQSMALQASLALWKYTAKKDWEYLEEEEIFLENLKKKSYR